MSSDPTEMLKKLAEQYRGIKFGRGVVGKTSYATLALIGLWTVIIFRLSENVWFSGGLIGCGLIATGIWYWWCSSTQAFATKNPELAMLEGAELIEYKKWEAEVKGIPGPLKGPAIPPPANRVIDADASE